VRFWLAGSVRTARATAPEFGNSLTESVSHRFGIQLNRLDTRTYVHTLSMDITLFFGAAHMATAVQRIVVQATVQDKRAIAAKAKKLDMPISELMRRGAFAYVSSDTDNEMGALADAAKGAADRAGAAIDDALDFIASSNERIAAMEAQVAKHATRKAA
jgi:hypothetical protein